MDEYKCEAYWDDIPTERENAVSYNELKQWWHTDERGVRLILHYLSGCDNGDNYVLIRSSKSKGFYKTDNTEEITAYKHECLNKGRSIFAPVRKINRILNANTKQMTMINNLRVIREERKLTQAAVCIFMKAFDEAFDVPMLSKMENGFCLPTPYQLQKLCELYGCQPSQLLETEFYY